MTRASGGTTKGADQLAAPLPSRDARIAAGIAIRTTVPPEAIGSWSAPADRVDPIGLLESQATTRLPLLVPVRYGRMATSPFTFYRGAALPMASDLSVGPNTGITVQLCGDAHISNFGLFASPERTLLFDINDFDETLPGPFEFDLKRLATSLIVAGRGHGLVGHDARHLVHRAMRSYRDRMAGYATMRAIDVYYARVDVSEIQAYVDKRARSMIAGTVKSSAHHDSIHESSKLTTVVDGERRISERPPTLIRLRDMTHPLADAAFLAYRETLQEDRRVLLDRYRFTDYALKVVGVGSVGLRAFVALFAGGSDDDPLLLQAKQAEASVYERYLGSSEHDSHGERVVTGQRRLQAASDILLGWAVGERGQHMYVRQLQDQKGSAVIDTMTADELGTWGELCAWALARGHARSGDPTVIAGYLGTDDAFVHAMATFAETYADQNELDHAALLAAITSGRITAEHGV